MQVLILPQRALTAPGDTLLEQVIYPSALPERLEDVETHQLTHVLQLVGLSDLLHRAQGDWLSSHEWQGGCVTAANSPMCAVT